MHRLNIAYKQFYVTLNEIWLFESDPNAPSTWSEPGGKQWQRSIRGRRNWDVELGPCTVIRHLCSVAFVWETKRPQADNSRSLIVRQVSCFFFFLNVTSTTGVDVLVLLSSGFPEIFQLNNFSTHCRVCQTSIPDGNFDHFVYVSRQWETTLQCNVVSHWLGTYKKRSLKKKQNMWEKNLGGINELTPGDS